MYSAHHTHTHTHVQRPGSHSTLGTQFQYGGPPIGGHRVSTACCIFTGNSKVVRCACYIFYKGEEVAVNFWDIFYSVLSYH